MQQCLKGEEVRRQIAREHPTRSSRMQCLAQLPRIAAAAFVGLVLSIMPASAQTLWHVSDTGAIGLALPDMTIDQFMELEDEPERYGRV